MMQQFFTKNEVTVSEWSGNYPDLNPVENFVGNHKEMVAKVQLHYQIKAGKGDNLNLVL